VSEPRILTPAEVGDIESVTRCVTPSTQTWAILSLLATLAAANERAEKAERERDVLLQEAGPIDRRLLQSVMLSIAHCDEEEDAEGLCSCAHYIGGLLRTHRRAACRAGKLADAAVARAEAAERIAAEKWHGILGDANARVVAAEAALADLKTKANASIQAVPVLMSLGARADEGANETTRDVKGCSACGRDHPIRFYELLRPIDDATHGGVCPNTGRAVLMREVSR
jgi:hypothetical protein